MKCLPIFTVLITTSLFLTAPAMSAPDVSGKVVLANLDRYEVSVKYGTIRRDVKHNHSARYALKGDKR